MKNMLCNAIVSLLTCIVALSASAYEVHVDVRAADGGDGSAAKPFRTAVAARDAVRSVRASGVLGSYERVDVVFAPGDYRIDGTIRLGAADGGASEEAPVVWRAEQPGTVRFVGAVRLPCESFAPVTEPSVRSRLPEGARDKVVVADVKAHFPKGIPNLRDDFAGNPNGPVLFVNHRHLPLARWPNEGFTSFSTVVDHGRKIEPRSEIQRFGPGAFVYSDPRAKRWDFADGVWLAGYWTHDWSFHSVRAASYGPENGTNDVIRLARGVPFGVKNKTWGGQGPRFYVFNVLDELDAPGEWYLDRTRGLLYLYPPNGVLTKDDEVFLGTLEDPMVKGDGLANFQLKGFSFEYSLGNGLELSGGGVRVVGCRIGCVGRRGVYICGMRNVIADSEVFQCGTEGVSISGGDRKGLVRSESAVENCDIHDFGIYCRTYAPGIALGGCGCDIRGNLIHDAPHSACIYGGNEHVIEYNNIHSVLMETGDAGAIYTGRDWTSQGNVIRFNFIHELGRIGAEASTMALYFDDCDCGDEVYGNVLWKVSRGIMVGGGRDIPIRNNIFADCDIGMSIDVRGKTWSQWNRPGTSWHLEVKAQRLGYASGTWAIRYPRLANIMNDSPREPLYNPVEHNVFYECRRKVVELDGKPMTDSLGRNSFVGNLVVNPSGTNDVCRAEVDARVAGGFSTLNGSRKSPDSFGFVNPSRGDFRFRPDARILREMSGFRVIPLWKIRNFEQDHARGPATCNGQMTAVECRPRSGIGHVMEKIKKRQPVRIAYFGGSITAMDGWRRLSREWLATRYPECSFTEIDAAIGGTGSPLGVYRFGQDVLVKKPDLVFVEFATNDRTLATEEIWRNFEGFVRQAWHANPDIDFVFVYTITTAMMSDYGSGLCPRAASAMERLADHYGIASVCFGPRVAEEVAKGKLVMSVGEVETAVPAETPDRDRVIAEALAKEGRTLFSKDGVHPTLSGHVYYLESLKASWPRLEGFPPVDHAQTLCSTFYDRTMENAKMVSITPEMLSGTWREVEANEKNGGFSGRFGGKPLCTSTPGSSLSFRFRGSDCSVYDLVGPACGQLRVEVDGVRRSSLVPRFDSYCTYYRLATMNVLGGDNAVHEVRLELDDRQPDRASVKIRGVTDAELAAEKYNGTEWYVGKLMIVGELLDSKRKGL